MKNTVFIPVDQIAFRQSNAGMTATFQLGDETVSTDIKDTYIPPNAIGIVIRDDMWQSEDRGEIIYESTFVGFKTECEKLTFRERMQTIKDLGLPINLKVD